MKKALLFAAFLISINVFAQETPEENGRLSILRIYDSIYTWKLDTSDLTWKFDTRDIDMVYDDELNLQSYTHQFFYGNTWINSAHFINSWDMNHYLIDQTILSWNGTVWANDFKIVYTYDDLYRKTGVLYQNWTGAAWENYQTYSITFDEFGNQTIYLHQDWEDGDWVNHYQDLYFYDSDQRKTRYNRQNWADTAWINDSQILYEYDENGNLSIDSHQFWENEDWLYIFRYVYTYNDNNKEIQRLNQNWSNGTWTDSYRSYLSYDENNDLVHVLSQSYFSSTGWKDAWYADYSYDAFHNETSFFSHLRYNNAWVSADLSYNTYDENNFKKSNSNRNWSQDGTQINEGDSTHNYFYTVVGIENPPESGQHSFIYPNPVSEEIFIDLADYQTSSEITLEIISLNGQVVLKEKISGPAESVHVGLLPSGLYFTRISDTRSVVTGKFIKR